MAVPSLSIVIPTLNEVSAITKAVEKAWNLKPLEVIVSDGGSTDGTLDQAERAGAKVIRGEASRGTQIRAGYEQSSGDVLLVLHADTWLSADAASQLLNAISCGAGWGAFRQSIDAAGIRYRALEWGNALRARRFNLPYGDQAIFAHRELIEQIGGLPAIPIMEDAAFSRQLSGIESPVLLPGPLYISARRWQQNGVIRQTLQNWAMLAAWRLGVSEERLAGWYRPHSSDQNLTARNPPAATPRAADKMLTEPVVHLQPSQDSEN